MIALRIVSLLSLLLAVGCTSTGYNSDHDPQTNFSSITTYSWGKNTAQGTDNRFLNGKPLNDVIQDGIDAELQAKGLRKVDSGGDVTVQYKSIIRYVPSGGSSGTVDQTRMAPEANDSFNISPGKSGALVSDAYPEGTVIVVMTNAAGKPVWRGVGQGVVQKMTDDSKRIERLQKNLKELLSPFPPK